MRRPKGFTLLEINISRRQSRRFLTGFTLIELLVVIAILTLLMAILLPVLRRVRNQARTVTCQANQKQWSQILALYTEDYQGRLPDWHLPAFLLLRGPYEASDNRRVSSYSRVTTEGIACCPMATRPGGSDQIHILRIGPANGESLHGEHKYGSTLGAWELTGLGPPFRCSYGFNGWLFHFFSKREFMTPGGIPWSEWLGLDIFSVRGGANIPIFLDATKPDSYPDLFRMQPPWSEFHEGDLDIGTYCVNRHNGYTNGLFADWSVRKVGLKELWTLKWHQEFDTANIWTKAGGVLPEDWPQWMRNFKDY